jgi:NTP pyrophosphatase (non-canonical NTP hydrolase)
MKTWILDVEEDPKTGDGILTLPQDLLDIAGWKEGDVLNWKDNKDGSWTLTKKMLQLNMDEQTKEVMDILQEECAEVIQAVSKISRFGLDNHKPGKPLTNREHLEVELGDVVAMVELLTQRNIVSAEAIETAKQAKFEKLKQWSKIYE